MNSELKNDLNNFEKAKNPIHGIKICPGNNKSKINRIESEDTLEIPLIVSLGKENNNKGDMLSDAEDNVYPKWGK